MTLIEAFAEIAKLRREKEYLINRVAGAAEVLGRVANRLPVCRCELEKAKEEEFDEEDMLPLLEEADA